MLDVAKREVTLQKVVVLQAMGMGEGAWTAAEMAAFTLKVHVHNVFSRRKPEPGHIIYTTPQRYHLQFADHNGYATKVRVGIIDTIAPPITLDVGGTAARYPQTMTRPGFRLCHTQAWSQYAPHNWAISG
jgi:hypothetical protein